MPVAAEMPNAISVLPEAPGFSIPARSTFGKEFLSSEGIPHIGLKDDEGNELSVFLPMQRGDSEIVRAWKDAARSPNPHELGEIHRKEFRCGVIFEVPKMLGQVHNCQPANEVDGIPQTSDIVELRYVFPHPVFLQHRTSYHYSELRPDEQQFSPDNSPDEKGAIDHHHPEKGYTPHEHGESPHSVLLLVLSSVQ